MFHRANAGKIHPQARRAVHKNDQEGEEPRTGMNQTALQRYAMEQEKVESQTANDEATQYAMDQQNQQETKEAKPMNNAEPKQQPQQQQQNNPAPQGAPQARVDIPGSNFQRPGAPRAAYPGSYPGAAQQPANTTSYDASANVSSDHKLVIGQGIAMSGEIESCEHLIVEGTVEASLKGADTLDISESGAFYGTVEIEDANIAGRFEGDITVRGRLTLESTGVIVGSIAYKELAIEAGATIDGSISPIGSQNAAQQGGKKAAPKSKKVSHNNGGAELPFTDKNVAAQ